MESDEAPMTVGIDIGSLTTKVLLLKGSGIRDFVIVPSTYDYEKTGIRELQALLQKNAIDMEDLSKIVATGYGRHSIPQLSAKIITEISAHARGVQHYLPNAVTIIDIGGQDSKVIKIDPNTHRVVDFQMNDKCAAGTGKFLEVMANSLEVPIAEFGDLALRSKNPQQISSMCTVFAESEVIGLFAKGTPKEDIAAGIHESIARRVGAMAKRVQVQAPVAFCGGVALNPAVKLCLEAELQMKLFVPPHPQVTGALGAALTGLDSL